MAVLTVGVFAIAGAETETEVVELWKTLPAPLPAPVADTTTYIKVNGVEIYCTIQGDGEPLILLHGGLGNTEYWGGQIAALSAKYKVINIASRGHGRSSRDEQAYSLKLMASDVLAVMDKLSIKKASILGWSDGANIGLEIAINNPGRLDKLFAFGGNFDPSGVKPTVQSDSVFGAYVARAAADYGRLSRTPKQFGEFVAKISEMWASEPKFTAEQLKSISIPVAVVEGEFNEAIQLEHVKKMAELIPGSTLILLPNLSHFALWQDPEAFNAAVLKFLDVK